MVFMVFMEEVHLNGDIADNAKLYMSDCKTWCVIQIVDVISINSRLEL